MSGGQRHRNTKTSRRGEDTELSQKNVIALFVIHLSDIKKRKENSRFDVTPWEQTILRTVFTR